MGHLGTGVLMLVGTGIGHRQHLARGLGADHDHRGVLHGQSGADVAVDPLHVALSLDLGPFGDQVVHVVGPVLDGGVGDPADFLTKISTTAECSESLVYTGAEHPSM